MGYRQSRYIFKLKKKQNGCVGRQLFTGSFHPVQDKMWENRKAWDKRVAPEEAVTLREIFERRAIVKMAAIRQQALNILSSAISFLGKDVVAHIYGYLDDKDCCMLAMAANVEANKPKKNIVVTDIPLPNPSTSLFFGNFYCEFP